MKIISKCFQKNSKKFLWSQVKFYTNQSKGNHEFYGNEYHSTKKQMKSILSKFENVTMMDKTSEKYNGIRYSRIYF
jgi:hypothetical protein